MHYPPDNEQPSQPTPPPFQQPPMQYPQQPPPGYQFQPPQGPYYPPQMPPKKSRRGLWIVLAVLLVAVVIACSVIGMAVSSTSKAVVSTGAQPTSDTSASSSSGNTVVKLGQTITVDDVSCTATSAQKISGDDAITPKKGNEFVVVHVKMVNNGTSDQTYNPYDFHAKSSAGNVTDTEAIPPSSYTANNTLDSGTLAPGGKVEGDMIFQIPTGDAKAELTWSPSFFGSSSQYAWVLDVK